MRRVIAAALLLAPLSAALAEDREEREARPNDDQLLYALGAALGARVRNFSFDKKELPKVMRGFADSAAGKKLKLPDQDLDEWGPKIDAFLARRVNPKVMAEKDRGAAFAAAAAREQGATRLPSGIVVKVLQEGTGPSPTRTDAVRVRYQGKLIDGTEFDSSSAHGGAPAELKLDRVMSCFTEGLQRVKAGGKARLVCPSDTAYRDAGRPPQIPGGATLVFEVELVEVKK